jgi:very-short-patch-repair endonuclease
MIDDRQLRALAERQHGLVATHQACELGYTTNQRHRLADGRRWERVGPRVLRLVGSAGTDQQAAMLAVLDAGAHAALCGTSAAAWWGIPGNLMRPVQVVRVRDQTNRPRRHGFNHEPTLLPPEHVVTLDGVPTVVPARALFDVAGTQRKGAELPWWVDRIARMVDTAWSMRLVSGRSLHAMLRQMSERGRPGIRVMRQVLEVRGIDYVPPASALESRFAQLMARAGLPPMRRQVDAGDGDRWIGRVDFRDSEVPLVVEIQSERFHASLIDRQLDAGRVRRLEAAGYLVLEVTETDVWHRGAEVVARVSAARAEAARRQQWLRSA